MIHGFKNLAEKVVSSATQLGSQLHYIFSKYINHVVWFLKTLSMK